MPRDIPVGNGSLLANFDSAYQLRDIYWPHVGQENHTAGHAFRFGIWVGGKFHWVADDDWQRTLDYVRDSLVTSVELTHPGAQLTLECHDMVDFHENLYLRKITVHNKAPTEREVRLFFAHDFHIGGYALGDSAYYEPERRAIFHYKGQRWFMINCARQEGEGWALGLDQWAVGLKEAQGREGTWRDAEDGMLSGNATAHGSVDSCAGLHLTVPGNGEATGWYWIAVGQDFPEVTRINRAVREKGPDTFLKRTGHYWDLWACIEDEKVAALPQPIRHLYKRSLLILRTQVDNGGAIIAASDFDVARYYSDTYSYMWPRDGALVAAALIDAGYSELTRRFFEFCHRVITDEGYLLHKYNADGSLASSWLGWYREGRKVLPIQEDETALVIWALWRHFQRFRDVEAVKTLFRGLVVRAANWMASYRDAATGLPLPSWDLWEERWGVSAWTVGATWGGLQAAANFADAFGESQLADNYRDAASGMRAATERYFWQADQSRYARMITFRSDGTFDVDATVESSLFGLWYFGMFPPDDPKITATMKAVRERLWVKTDVGGIARYVNDRYYQVSQDVERVPGNPWFICTLWFAQWCIAAAQSDEDLKAAVELMQWAATRALPSGVMAEQVNPYTDEPLSVSPLTWSHATLVLAASEYLARVQGVAHYTLWQPCKKIVGS